MAIARLPILLLSLGMALATGVAAQAPAQQQPAQAAPATANVTLPYSSEWVDGQVDVAVGDRLTLSVASAIAGAVMNPQGGSGPSSRARFPEFPYGAVIARIGDNPPFLVGQSWSNDAPAAGHLTLAINLTPSQQSSDRPLFTVAVENVPPVRAAEPQPDVTNTIEENSAAAVENQAAGPDEGTAANVVDGPRNEARPAEGGGGEGPGGGWLVPLLIGAAGAVALLLVGRLVKNALRPKPLPPLTVAVHPALDFDEGGVAGDEIALAGPEVRLRTALAPGGTFFDGGEPVIEREERDG